MSVWTLELLEVGVPSHNSLTNWTLTTMFLEVYEEARSLGMIGAAVVWGWVKTSGFGQGTLVGF